MAHVIEIHRSQIPASDLASNAPATSTRRKREQAHAAAPIWQLVGWFLGLRNDERSWRQREHGELTVAMQLSKLPKGWFVLHSVEINATTDIDHLVVGPGGVFALSSRCHPKSQASVNDRAVRIDGQPTKYLGKSREAALRASHMLSVVCRRHVPVQAAIVFVDLNRLVIEAMPDGVHVTTYRRLVDWLQSQPAVMTSADVEEVFAKARVTANWH
jgi:hypothetical protein